MVGASDLQAGSDDEGVVDETGEAWSPQLVVCQSD